MLVHRESTNPIADIQLASGYQQLGIQGAKLALREKVSNLTILLHVQGIGQDGGNEVRKLVGIRLRIDASISRQSALFWHSHSIALTGFGLIC